MLRSRDHGSQPVKRGLEAVIVKRRRPQLDREAADVVERGADECTDGGQCLRSDLGFELLQAEPDRGERLAGLVVKLAREPLPLGLLTFEQRPHGLSADTLGELDGHGCSIRKRLRQPHVCIGESVIGVGFVVRSHHAHGATVDAQRDIQGRRRIEQPRRRLVDLGIVDEGVDALRTVAFERPPGL